MVAPSNEGQQGTNSAANPISDNDFKQLLSTEVRLEPGPRLLSMLDVKDYQALYDEAARDIDGFWDKIARDFTWETPWTQVREGITENGLDRHANGSRANKKALIWVSEDGKESTYTFKELLAFTNQVANGLKSLGVKKGDRVCIYMPLTPEGIASMLACARLGAVHSVVYAGLGSGALRARIEDAQARVVITTDVGFRRGKETPLKSIIDEAVDGLNFVEKVIVHRRGQPQPQLNSEREVDFYELVNAQSTTCPAEIMEA